jgi:hypothetical protein
MIKTHLVAFQANLEVSLKEIKNRKKAPTSGASFKK